MEEQKVDYWTHENAMVRMERIIRRLVAAIIITVIALVASNFVWVYAWMQYDYSSDTSTITVDAADGIANYIGNDGDINNGADSGSTQDAEAN